MKKAACLFTLLLLALPILAKPNPALALCGPLTGPKLGNRIDLVQDGGSVIRQKYDADNADCQDNRVSVTVLFDLGAASDSTSQVQTILAGMKQNKLIPTIRLYTAYQGGGFERWDPNDKSPEGLRKLDITRKAARQLGESIKNAGFAQGEVIVYLGNEINTPDEWSYPGQGIDNASVTTRIKDFAQFYNIFAGSASTYYKLYLPPLNAYLGSGPTDASYVSWVKLLVSSTGRKDGAALTIYNATPAAINQDYIDMKNAYAGVSEFTISEVGPRVNGKLYDGTADLPQWESIMSDVYTAVGLGKILTDAKHINTSFFLNCGGELRSFLVVIHKDGKVHVEPKGELPQCEGSGAGAAVPCEELQQVAQTTTDPIAGFFAQLSSFFGGLFGPQAATGLGVHEVTTVDSHLVAETTVDDAHRYAGVVPLGSGDIMGGFSVSYPVQLKSALQFTLPVSKVLFGTATLGGSVLSDSAVYDMFTGVTPGGKEKIADTVLGYLLGPEVADREIFAENIQAIFQLTSQPQIDQTALNSLLWKIFNGAGPYEMLRFTKEKCENGQWKGPRNCDADWVTDRVLIGLDEDLNGERYDHRRLNDYIAGYAFDAENTLGARTDNGQVLQAAAGASTWIAARPAGKVSLPVYASMFACTSGNYQFAFDKSTDYINNKICKPLYGDAIRQGIIDPNSLMGKVIAAKYGIEALALQVPAGDALYGPSTHAYWWLPIAPIVDLVVKSRVTIDPGPDDPAGFSPPETKSAVPDVVAVMEILKRVRKRLMPYGVEDKPVQITKTPCGDKYTTGGVVSNEIAGGRIPETPYQFGQLVQRGDDSDSTKTKQGTEPVARSGTVTVNLPDEFKNLLKFSCGWQGLNSIFSPKEVVDNMNTPIPGTNVTIAQLPQKGDASCENDLNCRPELNLPVLGCVDLAFNPNFGSFTSAMSPYVPGQQRLNAGRIIKELAEGTYQKDVTVNPWQELASFASEKAKQISAK